MFNVDDTDEQKIKTAAEYIDKGQYADFEKIKKELDVIDSNNEEAYKNHYYPERDNVYCLLTDTVQTRAGIEYLAQKKLIPEDYFTDEDRTSDPVLSFASQEQIDFYVAHGVDINSEAIWAKMTTLDLAIYDLEPPEKIEKLIDVGCNRSGGNKIYNNLEQLNSSEYSEDEIHNALKTAALLLKRGFKPERGFFEGLSKNSEIVKGYPELVSDIMALDKRTDAEKAKDRICDKKKELKEIGIPKDSLQEKQKDLKEAFINFGNKKEDFGKTADSKGKVTRKHEDIAISQIEALKLHYQKTGRRAKSH